MIAIVEELLAGEKRSTEAVDLILQTAAWAAAAFAQYDHAKVDKIARAVAEAGHARASELAEAAVRETGYGVATDKKAKNEIASRGIYERYRKQDYCSKRVLAAEKIVELPRPAGVVLALTPSTNPVCTIYFKIVLALLTRNAIVISPDPMARACSIEAVRTMAAAAEKAGAPTGVIQIVEQPDPAVVDHLLRSSHIGVVLATGAASVVRAAHGSGNPAIGAGPGNVPVLVEASADIEVAAKRIVLSKSFDHSLLDASESVVIAEEAIADRLSKALARAGAYIAKGEEIGRLRDYLFGGGTFNAEAIGKSATKIARRIGLRIPPSARIIVTPIDRVGGEEPLSREKICPVLSFVRVPHAARGIAVSRAVVRLAGEGHSAAIHSRTPANILAFGASVGALRVVVNAPCSQGAAGIGTHLATSFASGTGFSGGSSVGGNLEPRHLVNWTRIAYSDDAQELFGKFDGLESWSTRTEIAVGRDAPMSLGRLQEGAP